MLISGEGGDEAFAGYPIYRNILWLERLKRILGPFKGPIGAALPEPESSTKVKKDIESMRLCLGRAFDSYYYSRTASPASFFNYADRCKSIPRTSGIRSDKDDSVGNASRDI